MNEMGYKNIQVTDEVYKKLEQLKRRDETFDDLFQRLLGKEDSLKVLTKLQGTINIPDKEKLVNEIYKKR
jgi:predicted CopG family antitoxin